MHEAKTNFSKLMTAVEAGEEIIVARAGKPILKLVKINEHTLPPLVPGFAKGLIPEWNDAEWDELDHEFDSLFRERSFDS